MDGCKINELIIYVIIMYLENKKTVHKTYIRKFMHTLNICYVVLLNMLRILVYRLDLCVDMHLYKYMCLHMHTHMSTHTHTHTHVRTHTHTS